MNGFMYTPHWCTSSAGDNKGNVHPGFALESGISSPSYHDFYLQSHSGIQGSKSPLGLMVYHILALISCSEPTSSLYDMSA